MSFKSLGVFALLIIPNVLFGVYGPVPAFNWIGVGFLLGLAVADIINEAVHHSAKLNEVRRHIAKQR
jgi:hypothetical protein